MFEVSNLLTWLFICFSLVALAISSRRSAQEMKHQLLHYLFATTLIIRCLEDFFG